MSTLRYWLWLNNLQGLPHSASFRLLEHFGTPEAVYFADPAEYLMVKGLAPTALISLREKSMDRVEALLAECDRLGVHILTLQDAQYPERLRQLTDPPAVLYIRGKLLSFDEEPAIAVVGAREATPYGLKTAGRLGLELAAQGALVVSGIARGVDSAALCGALQGGGSVVSVLGNGVDVPYPAENRSLYEDVAAAGALVSEYPPGTEARGKNFPVRNRIISGLSLGVVVVEGTETSGALITARLALDQNRDVFAVPGSIDAPMSRGPNRLIARGEAKLIGCGWDILEEYAMRYSNRIRRAVLPPAQTQERLQTVSGNHQNFSPAPEKKVDNDAGATYIDLKECGPEFTDDEREILIALQGRTMVTDDIIEATQIPARRVMSALTVLQIRSLVEEGPGKKFRALARLLTQ